MTASYCTRALSGLIIESLIRDHGIDFPYLVYMLFSFLLFVSFHHSSGCYFSTKRRDWLGRTSPKLPILCQVGHNIFTYSFFFMILSILQVFTSHTTPSFFLILPASTHCLTVWQSFSLPNFCFLVTFLIISDLLVLLSVLSLFFLLSPALFCECTCWTLLTCSSYLHWCRSAYCCIIGQIAWWWWYPVWSYWHNPVILCLGEIMIKPMSDFHRTSPNWCYTFIILILYTLDVKYRFTVVM